MSLVSADITERERELGAIISAYNDVTEKLKQSHLQLSGEVRRLSEELARKNRQLRRKERLAALGEMAAGVAHEIRNPLGGIQLFASLLRRDVADQPELVRLVDKIKTGVTRLETIVAGILEFGRPSEPHPICLDMRPFLRDTIELALARAGEAQVVVEAVESGNLEMVTDAAMLQRAVLNLLLNAIEAAGQAGRQGGTVRLSTALDAADQVSIAVEDDGPGIPPELLDRIFNPFFTTKDTGTGLGLAIVHQIAESLGGGVQAANRTTGGAVFTLRLPRVLMATGYGSAGDTGDESGA